MPISIYAVGIYFRKEIAFTPDGKDADGTPTMSGIAILATATALGLNYRVDPKGLITVLSYTPTAADFAASGRPPSPNAGLAGQALVLAQAINHYPTPSLIFQYTSNIPPAKPVLKRPPFAGNQFFDNSDIRIRLLSIYTI